MHKDYYTYELRHPNGRTFYVGKGRRYRITAHERDARNGKVGYRFNIIRKIWASGGKVVCRKIEEGLTADEAAAAEKVLIARHGFKNQGGTLVNLTAGGEGSEGYRHDLVSLAKMKEAHERRGPVSQETKDRMRAAMLGKQVSKETRKKISERISGDGHWNYGKTISDEHKRRLHGARCRPVEVNGIKYESRAAAGRALGVSEGTIGYRVRVGWEGYR